jgi:hypothetical protein
VGGGDGLLILPEEECGMVRFWFNYGRVYIFFRQASSRIFILFFRFDGLSSFFLVRHEECGGDMT